MMSKIMDFDKNDASGGNLIENYRSYNIWKFSCIELSISKIKSPNFIRTKDRHRITYVLVS